MAKRAQGGSDFDLDHLVALCRTCHERTDTLYARGRLVVTPRGAGRFVCAQALWEHVRGLRPDWPTPEERCADLAHQVALKRALALAAGAFRSAAHR